MKNKKNYKLTKTNNGYILNVETPLIISRDTNHFQHQLRTRQLVQEDKRFKKERYKKDYHNEGEY